MEIGKIGEKTWQSIVIHQICHSFLLYGKGIKINVTEAELGIKSCRFLLQYLHYTHAVIIW